MSITPDDTGVKVMKLTPLCPVCGLVVAVREGLAYGKYMYHKPCVKDEFPGVYAGRLLGLNPFLTWLKEEVYHSEYDTSNSHRIDRDWERGHKHGEDDALHRVLAKYKEMHP